MAKQEIPPIAPGVGTFRWAVKNPPADPTTSFAGKTILITGPNSGIGLDAAIKFARLGASTLIFGVRSLERGQKAKELIERTTGCDSNVIHLFELDMASHKSIQQFSKKVSSQFREIHVALLNAGVSPVYYRLSPDGWENALQIHVISTTQLAILLLPTLKRTANSTGKPSTLQVVTSHGYLLGNLETLKTTGSILQKVNEKAHFGIPKQYVATKLLQMWVVDHIAAKTSPSQVIVSSCCPGLTNSNIGRDVPAIVQLPFKAFAYFCNRKTEEGSRTLVSGALLGKEAHGGFWSNDHIYEPGDFVHSEEAKALSNKCWEETLATLKKQIPDIDLSEVAA